MSNSCIEEVLRALGGTLIGPRTGPEFADTICFTCGRSAVPGDYGEPGCPECIANQEKFASYTGRKPD
jgi:hypothetical protein